eukprot:914760-Rhodomonas_salina.1
MALCRACAEGGETLAGVAQRWYGLDWLQLWGANPEVRETDTDTHRHRQTDTDSHRQRESGLAAALGRQPRGAAREGGGQERQTDWWYRERHTHTHTQTHRHTDTDRSDSLKSLRLCSLPRLFPSLA